MFCNDGGMIQWRFLPLGRNWEVSGRPGPCRAGARASIASQSDVDSHARAATDADCVSAENAVRDAFAANVS